MNEFQRRKYRQESLGRPLTLELPSRRPMRDDEQEEELEEEQEGEEEEEEEEVTHEEGDRRRHGGRPAEERETQVFGPARAKKGEQDMHSRTEANVWRAPASVLYTTVPRGRDVEDEDGTQVDVAPMESEAHHRRAQKKKRVADEDDEEVEAEEIVIEVSRPPPQRPRLQPPSQAQASKSLKPTQQHRGPKKMTRKRVQQGAEDGEKAPIRGSRQHAEGAAAQSFVGGGGTAPAAASATTSSSGSEWDVDSLDYMIRLKTLADTDPLAALKELARATKAHMKRRAPQLNAHLLAPYDNETVFMSQIGEMDTNLNSPRVLLVGLDNKRKETLIRQSWGEMVAVLMEHLRFYHEILPGVIRIYFHDPPDLEPTEPEMCRLRHIPFYNRLSNEPVISQMMWLGRLLGLQPYSSVENLKALAIMDADAGVLFQEPKSHPALRPLWLNILPNIFSSFDQERLGFKGTLRAYAAFDLIDNDLYIMAPLLDTYFVPNITREFVVNHDHDTLPSTCLESFFYCHHLFKETPTDRIADALAKFLRQIRQLSFTRSSPQLFRTSYRVVESLVVGAHEIVAHAIRKKFEFPPSPVTSLGRIAGDRFRILYCMCPCADRRTLNHPNGPASFRRVFQFDPVGEEIDIAQLSFCSTNADGGLLLESVESLRKISDDLRKSGRPTSDLPARALAYIHAMEAYGMAYIQRIFEEQIVTELDLVLRTQADSAKCRILECMVRYNSAYPYVKIAAHLENQKFERQERYADKSATAMMKGDIPMLAYVVCDELVEMVNETLEIVSREVKFLYIALGCRLRFSVCTKETHERIMDEAWKKCNNMLHGLLDALSSPDLCPPGFRRDPDPSITVLQRILENASIPGIQQMDFEYDSASYTDSDSGAAAEASSADVAERGEGEVQAGRQPSKRDEGDRVAAHKSKGRAQSDADDSGRSSKRAVVGVGGGAAAAAAAAAAGECTEEGDEEMFGCVSLEVFRRATSSSAPSVFRPGITASAGKQGEERMRDSLREELLGTAYFPFLHERVEEHPFKIYMINNDDPKFRVGKENVFEPTSLHSVECRGSEILLQKIKREIIKEMGLDKRSPSRS